MSEQIDNQLPKGKKKVKLGRPPKKEKGAKWKTIFIIFLSIITVFTFLVIGHFLYKSCSKKDSEKPYQVHMESLPSDKWTMKVNNSDKDFRVNLGDEIKVKIYPNGNYADCLNTIPNDVVMFYVKVSPLHGSSKNPIWSSELSLSQDQQSYETSFLMAWDYDISLSVVSSTDYEESYYTLDENGNQKYIYEKTSIHKSASDASIIQINAIDLTKKEIKKSEFNEEIWIGKKVKEIGYGFLSYCSSYNKPLHFQADGQLSKIDDFFLSDCVSFNQSINFPETLTTISGNFMFQCSSFNQPIDFGTISDVNYVTSILYSADSFNSPVTIGKKMQSIPQYFLMNCKSFNQNITIPEQIKTINPGFLGLCNSMCSTITVECPESAFNNLRGSQNTLCVEDSKCDSYTKGLKAAGKNAEKFKAVLPDMLEGTVGVKMYRKWVN